MIQRREKLRFPLEPPKALVVLRERFGQHLNRDLGVELGITRAVDLTHSARSDGSDDLVVGEFLIGCQRHGDAILGGFGLWNNSIATSLGSQSAPVLVAAVCLVEAA